MRIFGVLFTLHIAWKLKQKKSPGICSLKLKSDAYHVELRFLLGFAMRKTSRASFSVGERPPYNFAYLPWTIAAISRRLWVPLRHPRGSAESSAKFLPAFTFKAGKVHCDALRSLHRGTRYSIRDATAGKISIQFQKSAQASSRGWSICCALLHEFLLKLV